ncbi:MAG: MmgE/PrpD family protein [Steroidobacteraceae bacterium]
MTAAGLPAGPTIAARLAAFSAATRTAPLPEPVHRTIALLLKDIAGLCVAARTTDYVKAALASSAGSGRCSAIGHPGLVTPYDAALINGTAAHGEDYDDTFEGGPVHAGAVIVPAVLAIAEDRGLSGDSLVKGCAVGIEILCRMSLVAPQATHRASFHPTAVMGAPAAAIAVATCLGLPASQVTQALGIAGSLSSGIIEYLADGSSTKRLHAGAAAQSGIRAALLAAAGFTGPATVFEGQHGFYKAFAPSLAPNFHPLVDGLGTEWVTPTVAFKPYACGTMTQPFIDCAVEAAAELDRRGLTVDDIESVICSVGQGTVHRLWEPIALKRSPPNGYAGKFSTPYCVAAGFIDRRAGLGQFTDEHVRNPALLALAGRVSYVVDPDDEYPRNYTGRMRVTLRDGSTIETRKGHLRGGAREPLSEADIDAKFLDNVRFGGGSPRFAVSLKDALSAIAAGGPVRLNAGIE